ncbi:bacteriohopanetetrol glucosamine biosynthesis glycosyltransferase HpnI [Chelatococcus reniformis]|uniref:Glucosyltransferase n=1 Tax=Chelatococcus reniformis TaxID=1494448 RepID=A0A916XCM8_9HYPH|nr:bacteriohopanetetrol glucosamine biosynthesis glycosyltransferase HpnI [Chelatococcus reniformis]GGC62053.1 glucosyltransferase [Chelatococcus reniformis]
MIGTAFAVLAALGCLYLLYAAYAAAGARRDADASPDGPAPTVTLLKPLHGAEPGLFENLSSFCAQGYAAPVQIVCGVQDPADGAIAVVERLRAAFPHADIDLVIDPAQHGANRKVGNLINMLPLARHDCLVLADSDVGVSPDYLRRVTAALAEPGVGAVTCLYRGVAAAGIWSRLSALAIDGHFLPNVLVGLKSGLARPCLGSTIALSRARLTAIGGLAGFADQLADDYAIGAALRAKGLRVAVPNFAVRHSCTEGSLADLWRHELRWARTIRQIEPGGHLGSLVTHPLGWALLAAVTGAPTVGAALAVGAICCRMVLLRMLARRFGTDAAPPLWLVPPRDVLSFAVFAWSFCGRTLTWRGRSYQLRGDGSLRRAGRNE